ncbi:MAG TPA: lipopolysaccharide kinase InaA family protein [Chryseolinea sp.]|nr:lipopolysaccharide kinase InaA family protein [Chryseolinea sp.]
MNRYMINEGYLPLEEFVLGLPKSFDGIGEIILNNRNVIKKVATPQGTFVIKNFKGMYFFNRLAYSLFRKSKAERSYLYSLRLRDKGILTPPPVAWIDCYRWGLLTDSYFISAYYPSKTLSQIFKEPGLDDYEAKKTLYKRLASFALTLHRLDIYHDDFSSGNILIIDNPDSFSFALVDLNRVLFRKVSYRDGLQNFAKLGVPKEDLNMLIREYAILSGQPIDNSIDAYWATKKRSDFVRSLRKNIRRYTLTPLEQIVGGK